LMFILGLGEAANFPACIKTVAEWFPKRERALATGLFNSGANAGNILTPWVVPIFTSSFTWRGAFVATGAIGLLWLVFWLWMYKSPQEHRGVSVRELALIESDPMESPDSIPWGRLIPCRELWAFAIAKFLTDPIWWFYLFWIPGYLQTTFHLNLAQSRTPVVICYAISIIGSIGGGMLSSALISRGISPNVARKSTMLICAACIAPIFLVPFMHQLWIVVALMGLATAGHQGWSATIFTLPSDMFPKSAVGSVTGIGGMAGGIGGVLLQIGAGTILTLTHSYVSLFLMACLAYPVALISIHLLTPKLAPAKMH
jgi:MFS transporter, ACS family, hexuronate transporter